MIPGIALLQKGKIWYLVGMFVSYIGSFLLYDNIKSLVKGYVDSSFYVTLVTYLTMFVLAFYIFPWLISKTMGVGHGE